MGDFSPTVATTVSGMDDDVREALAKDMTIDLTTIGRKSGEPRRIEIWMIKVGDRIVITGTPGPRDWFANLLADPTCIIHLKERIRVDLPPHVRNLVVPDGVQCVETLRAVEGDAEDALLRVVEGETLVA